MTKSIKQAMTSKWLLVVREYELVKQKRSNNFNTVDEICQTYKVNRKDIRKYYERWIKSGRSEESLLPQKRGPKAGSLKMLSKEEERTIMAIHRKLGANEFEIHHLIKGKFKVHPSVSTIYRTFKRYPLNKKRIERIKRYEKRYPGEQAHSDTYYLAKTLFIDRRQRYLFGLLDDCTRLCYVELVQSINSATITKSFFKGYKWFAVYGINIKEVLTDNGSEFTAYTSRKVKDFHFFETMLKIVDIKTAIPDRTDPKLMARWRILYDECIRL